MEATSAYLLTLGVSTLVISWILLLIAAWKEDYSWGLCSVFLPPLAYLYGMARLDKAGESLLLAVIGWVLIWFSLS